MLYYSVNSDSYVYTLDHDRSGNPPVTIHSEYWQPSMAEECAEDYHLNHDGWEDSWPVTITLYDDAEGETAIAKYSVDREAVPHFYATKIGEDTKK